MKKDEVIIETERLGDDKYRISVMAELDSPPQEVWKLVSNWEDFVAVGLPGMTSQFEWFSGGPEITPSKFQFLIAGVFLKEEIYEMTSIGDDSSFTLRYRALEPALGVEEYDAVLELQGQSETTTEFKAVREVRLEAGSSPDMLVDMIKSETECLKAHFQCL